MLWPFLIALGIFLVSGVSDVAVPKVEILKWQDKLQHFLVFGLFATAIIRIPRVRNMRWKGVLLAVGIVSIYGACDEWHQSFTPGRSVEFDDWIADTLGAIVAVTVYCQWRWYRRLLECSPKWRRTKSSKAQKSCDPSKKTDRSRKGNPD